MKADVLCRRSVLVLSTCAVLVGAITGPAYADIYDAPATYYNTAYSGGVPLTGTALRTALHDTIDGHTARSYDSARYSLQILDEDTNNPGNMILFYDNTDLNVAVINPNATNTGSSIKGWDAGVSWQREHTWPQSRQVTTSGATTTTGPDYADLFLLRPAGASNQSRSNLNYGGSAPNGGGTGPGIATVGGVNYYFPGNAHKGDAARGAFYADVRYDGTDTSTVNLVLVNGNPASSTGQMGDLASLLRYHYEDVPDQWERRRNDLIYRPDNWSTSSRYTALGSKTYEQGNRNPFIDHPEWVWALFGDGANDSQLSVATPGSNGASSATVNFGRMIVGGTAPTLTSAVTISKGGTDPTYYAVTPSGLATSSITGGYNAFTYNAGTNAITVGLTANTSTIGIQSGQIVVDNLDITNSGTGTGALDGNDTIDVSLTVLGHSEASFSTVSNTDSLIIDLGTVNVGSSASTMFSIANFGGSLTAGLDLDSITGSGNTTMFSSNLALFTALTGGSSNSFNISFIPTAPGSWSATYVLGVSDENISGATSGTSLMLTVEGFGQSLGGRPIPEPSSIFFHAPLILFAIARYRR